MHTRKSGAKVLGSALALSLVSALALPSRAGAYDIDCKVILCIAGGFPSGCGDASSYMLKRLRRGKPPFGFCAFGSGRGEGVDYQLDMGTERWTECPGGYETSWEREHGEFTFCVGGLRECSQSYIRITIPENDGGVYDSGRHRYGHPFCKPGDNER